MYKKLFFTMLAIFSFTLSFAQSKNVWHPISAEEAHTAGTIKTIFDGSGGLHFRLDVSGLKTLLAAAPDRFLAENGIIIALPTVKGETQHFKVYESSNFSIELQQAFPEIRAYVGIGIEDPTAQLRLSISPKGIQTMVLRGGGQAEFIEPYTINSEVYIAFVPADKKATNKIPFTCLPVAANIEEEVLLNIPSTHRDIMASNAVLKTFRLALSCTAEYTAYHGGTVAGALAGMNATLSRINGVYERDLAVKLELIANNVSIIYTNPNTDPYSDASRGSQGAWSNELQTTLNRRIGNSNYDMGHLFGATGGGGFAGCIGCVCNNGKGSAYTSPINGIPESDTFDIDFAAHEMGHQLGANHTYSVDNEGEGVNIEPGSGSTIMGYAGITEYYDVQQHSDAYFAYRSIKQIQDNLVNKTCPVVTVLNNQEMVINAGLDYTIPRGTAFLLKAAGAGANNANVTYNWEQNDNATNNTVGDNSIVFPAKREGPTFRSVLPVSSPDRYMPALSSVLNNTLTANWETVSTVARPLNFTLTGRDNIPAGGQTKTDAMVVTVSAAAGPFRVTSQNTQGVLWTQGSSQSVTWDVAGTTANSINTANVNILLSTDGGQTFPVILASGTPNDGSEVITVPNVLGSLCRVMVQAAGNIYYAVNQRPFAIGVLGAKDFGLDGFVLYPNPNAGNFTIEFASVTTNAINVAVNDMSGRQVFNKSYKNTGLFSANVQLQGIASGVYLIAVQDGNSKVVKRIVVE